MPVVSGGASPTIRTALLDCRYRVSSSFDIVRPSELTQKDLERVSSIRSGAEFEFVLLPRHSGLSVKAITADMAALLESLRSPGRLPDVARDASEQFDLSLKQLVLDGVLEVETDGLFVSGVGAAAFLDVPIPKPRPKNHPALLSLQALRYGQALESQDGPKLAARLYGYNTVPVSPRWTRRIGSEADVLKYLGLERSGETRRLLDRGWRAGVAPAAPSWLIWRLRPSPPAGSRFKLYISPRSEQLAQALQLTVPILTELEIPAFKVGRDLPGLLRPDKFVIYAPTLDVLHRARTALSQALDGLAAQGVPFTAPADNSGLISWGIDPPESESLSKSHGTSWRRWLTERLAVSILVAKRSWRSSVDPEPWRFALARLSLDGIDANTWLPTGATWAPRQ